MYKFLKERVNEITITLVTLLACFIFFTPVHDDYGSFFLSMAARQFSPFSFMSLHYMGMIGIHFFYEWLYNHFAAVNWMGLAFMGFQLLGLYLFLRALKTIALKNVQNRYVVIAVQILFALFFLENIISLSHTRFSLLLCGLSLFYLAFEEELKPRQILLYSLLFFVGLFHRPESSVGMILLVGTGFMLWHFRLLHLIKRFFLPAVVTVILFGVIIINLQHTQVFMEKIEPEIEYKMMDKRVVPLSDMHTATDSIKYTLATLGMWFDPHTLTPEYLRSLQLPGANLSVEHATKILQHTLKHYQRCSFTLAFNLCLILLCFFVPGGGVKLLRLVVFQAATFAIVYALDYNGRLVSGRHFLNLQLISLLISAFYFFEGGATVVWSRGARFAGAAALLCLAVANYFTLCAYKTDNDNQAAETKCYEQTMQQVDATYHHRLIVATMADAYLLDHTFSVFNKNYANNTYIMWDVFTYSLIPEYTAYLHTLCNCDPLDPVAFYTWLQTQNALYMADPTRYDLTERYMNLVHGQQLKFLIQDSLPSPDCVADTHLCNYELRTVMVNNR
jgi:hypothetical protein